MSNKTIVIAQVSQGTCMACVENERVKELQYYRPDKANISIGDIYIGRVQKIVPSLNAAFIEVQPNQGCYYDMRSNANPIFTHKIGNKPLTQDSQLLVQVEKEGVKTKAPTVTSNLSFTGNYIVLTSGNTKISVSSKIKDHNRGRLKEILTAYESESYGLIARTNAKDASEEIIRGEIEELIQSYESLVGKAQTRNCYTCMSKSNAPYISFIRDMYKGDVHKIMVDSLEIYQEIQEYLMKNLPDLGKLLVLYDDSNYTLDKLYSLEIRMQEAFHRKVWMKSGAYLVIDPTEALTVIDVNSGKCVTKKDTEEQYFRINVEAAIEAAHQIRFRNISGIIIIDFINLKSTQKMQEVLKILKEHLQNDRIPTKLIGVTKLQLVEITRKKNFKSLQESLRENYGQERTQNQCYEDSRKA